MKIISFEDCPPKEGNCMPLWEGGTYDIAIILLYRSASNIGHKSWRAFHRKRYPTSRTLEIAYPHTAILKHLNQCLFKTVWTDIVLGKIGKRIDRRTAFKLRQFILAF